MIVLITGSAGFVGRNLRVSLAEMDGVRVFGHDIAESGGQLDEGLAAADVVYHLAGVNRPKHQSEFADGNVGSLEDVCARVSQLGRMPKIVLTSSIQAELDNPYGRSKREAEEVLRRFCVSTGAPGVVYRLKNLFGKWCRPNYNSVTATFCHNIAHDLPIEVSDPSRELDLTYIDDVVAAFVSELGRDSVDAQGFRFADPLPSYKVTLGELAALITSFRASRSTLRTPDFSRPLVRALYATYLSCLDPDDFAYDLDRKVDQRGSLAEFVKAPGFGQVFVSRTKPGITRGNHYHHTKAEKFLVVEGDAVIRFRRVGEDTAMVEYRVSGRDYRVVDIPPGYTHSIENVGNNELVTLFWANELFDPQRPDTQPLTVLSEERRS